MGTTAQPSTPPMVNSIQGQKLEVAPQAPQAPQTPALSYRAELTIRANKNLPLTTEGLPVGYYRSDLLPPQKPDTPQEEMQAIRNAYIDLSFEHGYPTQPDGRPWWHKLDFEPGFAYGAFQIYLEQIDRGPRELFSLAENKELRHLATKMHYSAEQIAELPENLIPKDRLHRIIYEYSILYYWRWRSKANDLYKDAAYRHIRLRRQMSVEDTHFSLSERLLTDLQEKVVDTPEFWDGMSAKTAVDMLKALVAIQRISVGLPAQGPLSQKETPEDSTFEMILRSIGQKTAQGNTYENGGGANGGRQLLDTILSDPNAAGSMQELIVRITRSQQQVLPNPHEANNARQFKGRGRATQIITDDDFTTGLDVTNAPGTNLDQGSEDPKN